MNSDSIWPTDHDPTLFDPLDPWVRFIRALLNLCPNLLICIIFFCYRWIKLSSSMPLLKTRKDRKVFMKFKPDVISKISTQINEWWKLERSRFDALICQKPLLFIRFGLYALIASFSLIRMLLLSLLVLFRIRWLLGSLNLNFWVLCLLLGLALKISFAMMLLFAFLKLFSLRSLIFISTMIRKSIKLMLYLKVIMLLVMIMLVKLLVYVTIFNVWFIIFI